MIKRDRVAELSLNGARLGFKESLVCVLNHLKWSWKGPLYLTSYIRTGHTIHTQAGFTGDSNILFGVTELPRNHGFPTQDLSERRSEEGQITKWGYTWNWITVASIWALS